MSQDDIDARLATIATSTRGLEKYIIYRDGVNIGETTELTFVDADLVGGTYEYTVESVYTSGVSDLTEVVTVEVAEIVATVASAELISNNNIEVTWTAVAGATIVVWSPATVVIVAPLLKLVVPVCANQTLFVASAELTIVTFAPPCLVVLAANTVS